jgi:hypothetical protein
MRLLRWLSVLLLLSGLCSGCLGTLATDPRAESVALVPQSELDLPMRDSRRHWLLRGEPDWCGGHEVRYGGDPDDPAVAAVRVVMLRDMDAAAHAFKRLTPNYLYSTLRGRIVDVPRPFDYPEPLAGDAVSVTEYEVRLPLVNAPDFILYGQLTAVLAGRAVILVESIGVHPEHLVPAIRELVRAAHRLPPDEC